MWKINQIFGYQVIYDQDGEIVNLDKRLRQAAVNMSLDKLVDEIHRLEGILHAY